MRRRKELDDDNTVVMVLTVDEADLLKRIRLLTAALVLVAGDQFVRIVSSDIANGCWEFLMKDENGVSQGVNGQAVLQLAGGSVCVTNHKEE